METDNVPDVSNEIKERFFQLPHAVRNAISSASVEKHLRELSESYQLHFDQWEKLENEVMLALLGFQPAENLKHNIQREVGISAEVAQALANGISEHIFEPIRQELERETETLSAQERALEPQAESPQEMPIPAAEILPATPPTPRPEARAVRASLSAVYKAGEMSSARAIIAEDPYREQIA